MGCFGRMLKVPLYVEDPAQDYGYIFVMEYTKLRYRKGSGACLRGGGLPEVAW